METELMISLETRPGQAPEWLCLLPLGEITRETGASLSAWTRRRQAT
ncbi:MAG: hypothetical protein M0P73_17140 [Syntrophobacterales bacterium]|jgi:hypothetical protein|nr:hypothetical protein [Syntrophobacterales bacterium]